MEDDWEGEDSPCCGSGVCLSFVVGFVFVFCVVGVFGVVGVVGGGGLWCLFFFLIFFFLVWFLG